MLPPGIWGDGSLKDVSLASGFRTSRRGNTAWHIPGDSHRQPEVSCAYDDEAGKNIPPPKVNLLLKILSSNNFKLKS